MEIKIYKCDLLVNASLSNFKFLFYNISSSKLSISSSSAIGSSGLPRMPRDIVPDEAVDVRWERLLVDCSLREKRVEVTRDEGSFCLDSPEELRARLLPIDSDRGRPDVDLGREDVESLSGLVANSTTSGSNSAGVIASVAFSLT